MRTYPSIRRSVVSKLEPISFIVIHFSDEYFHNIAISTCVQDRTNQLVRVDNRAGQFFDNLSSAINHGLSEARHDLVVVVHEDVLLLDGWQHQFEEARRYLEATDPDWGLVGAVGWDQAGKSVGSFSDPHQCADNLGDRQFAEVVALDEQLLAFRRSTGLDFDAFLPSIHNVGRMLASKVQAAGRKTYVLNAPTVHKFADGNGRRIESSADSPKIQSRGLPVNLAEWRCSDTYTRAMWPNWTRELGAEPDDLGGTGRLPAFGAPVIGLSRSRSIAAILSGLLPGLRWFPLSDDPMPETSNWCAPRYTRASAGEGAGDPDVLSEAVYRAVYATYQRRAGWQGAQAVPRLRAAAARVLASADARPGAWGINPAEGLLILPMLDQAFPRARFIHLLEDPLITVADAPGLCARLDNALGRTALRAAYAHCGLEAAQVLIDAPALHTAYTTRHQLEAAREYADANLAGRWLEIRAEDLVDRSEQVRAELVGWLGGAGLRATDDGSPNGKRADPPGPAVQTGGAEVERALGRLREELGYR